jgi:hypothetical protein
MTLWHIADFEKLTEELPRPLPWKVVGVMPTQREYLALGNIAYGPDYAFCYTVSPGPTELWCPMSSIEGRFCPPELITGVLNVFYTAVGANQLGAEDNVIVPFEYGSGPLVNGDQITAVHDAVFWIGTPEEDPDRSRFHCFASPHAWVLPVRWSSPEGWPDE